MKNIILFGGAFDPIHNGHLNMAFFASKELDADVLFIPAKKSVWKDETAPISDKINMIKLAISGYPRFKIDTFEADRKEDVTYSIETVRHFASIYKDANLYYLIGVDQVNEFHRWKECDEIAKLVKLIFFVRPGFEVKQENVDRFHMIALKANSVSGAASNQIRDLQSFEAPLEVLNYIVEHRLYLIPKLETYFTEKRFNHSKSVAKLAYEIAMANGFKTSGRAYLAGLLHDLGKNVLGENAEKIMKEQFPEYFDMPLWSYHQFIGSYLAKNDFKVVDEEILKAIEYHATGKDSMTDLQKIVYAADKLDPNRGYDSTELIEAMKNDISGGFLIVLKENIDYIKSCGKNISNKLTDSCIKYYLK